MPVRNRTYRINRTYSLNRTYKNNRTYRINRTYSRNCSIKIRTGSLCHYLCDS